MNHAGANGYQRFLLEMMDAFIHCISSKAVVEFCYDEGSKGENKSNIENGNQDHEREEK